MGFEDLISNLVLNVADPLTKSLQSSVTWEAWTGNDGYGKPTYATGVTLKAIVDQKQRRVVDFEGQEVVSAATLTIMQDVAAEGSTDRREPIDPRDRLTLPNGAVSHPIAVEGVVNPDTSEPYVLTVHLGEA